MGGSGFFYGKICSFEIVSIFCKILSNKYLNGVNGYKVQSKKTGFTDKWIFLSAAGYRGNTNLYDAGSRGYYWSNRLHIDLKTAQTAWLLGFYSDTYSAAFYITRFAGLSVRPVRP